MASGSKKSSYGKSPEPTDSSKRRDQRADRRDRRLKSAIRDPSVSASACGGSSSRFIELRGRGGVPRMSTTIHGSLDARPVWRRERQQRSVQSDHSPEVAPSSWRSI